MLWISGQGLRYPSVLIACNRIAAKKLVLPVLLIAILLGWPLFALAGNTHHSTQVSETSLRTALLQHFERWKGTPYRYGGNSRYGIDCSGFVHTMFRDALGVEVPRSTQLLSQAGRRVSFQRLEVGDIIVFRTSRKVLHVGIYVGNHQFIHASKSKGVMISKLSNPYWVDAYEKSVRVIDRRI